MHVILGGAQPLCSYLQMDMQISLSEQLDLQSFKLAQPFGSCSAEQSH